VEIYGIDIGLTCLFTTGGGDGATAPVQAPRTMGRGLASIQALLQS